MAHHLLQNTKQCFSLSDIDPNPYFDNMIGFHHDNDDDVFTQLPPGLGVNLENYPGLFINPDETTTVVNSFTAQPNEGDHKQRKRKLTMDIATPETSSAYSSPQGSEITKTNRSRRGKKAKRDEKEDEQPREVVHVRAKRGQATDSHSLAERVRRKKINERLRCLQDIVPGCYKTMGMAVMLDEIINYVQSLQSQVEFLSMRLTAASTFYDCNSDADAMETVQRAKVFEAMNVQDTAIQGFSSAQFGN